MTYIPFFGCDGGVDSRRSQEFFAYDRGRFLAPARPSRWRPKRPRPGPDIPPPPDIEPEDPYVPPLLVSSPGEEDPELDIPIFARSDARLE